MFSVCSVCTSGLRLKNLKRHKKHSFLLQEKWILWLAFNPGFASGSGFRATRQSVLKFRLRFLPLLEPQWVNWQSPIRKNRLIEWKKSLIGQCLPSQVFPLSLLAYPKTQGHLNDPSVLLHREFGLFPQVWLPVAHSSISERYNGIQILVMKWFDSEESWLPQYLTCGPYSYTSSTEAIGKSWHLTLVFSPQGIVNVGWRIVGIT